MHLFLPNSTTWRDAPPHNTCCAERNPRPRKPQTRNVQIRKLTFRNWETPVCSQNVCSQLLCPSPPPPNQRSDGFPLDSRLKGPQTELRTLMQPKLRTKPPKIANRQNYEQTGVSEKKSLMSIKMFAPNSRAGNGCAHFMGAWDFWLFL